MVRLASVRNKNVRYFLLVYSYEKCDCNLREEILLGNQFLKSTWRAKKLQSQTSTYTFEEYEYLFYICMIQAITNIPLQHCSNEYYMNIIIHFL